MTNSQVRLIPPLDADCSTLLAWLKEQHARGLLPTEVAISTIIVLLEKLDAEQIVPFVMPDPGTRIIELTQRNEQLDHSLGVYKRVVELLQAYLKDNELSHKDTDGYCFSCALENALDAVDKLEGK